jgi:uncharacterized membrane protein YbhN (UPF0104 family)
MSDDPAPPDRLTGPSASDLTGPSASDPTGPSPSAPTGGPAPASQAPDSRLAPRADLRDSPPAVAAVLVLFRSKWVRALFVSAAVALLCLALVDEGSTLRREAQTLSAPIIATAFIAGLAGLACSLMVWKSVLADLGSPISLGDACRIMFIGQLGKYIPGSVWPVFGQMELGAERGIPRSRSAVSVVLSSAVMVLTGGLVAACTVPFGARGSIGRYWWVLLVVPVGAVLLSPPLLNRLLGFTLRLLRAPAIEERVTVRGLAISAGWACLGWLFNGAMVYVMMRRLAGSGGAIALVSVGGFALSWVAGYLAVFAPAGAGVREAVLVAVLGTQTRTSVALVVAVVARALTVAADAAAGGLAMTLVGRRRLRTIMSSRRSTDSADRPELIADANDH